MVRIEDSLARASKTLILEEPFYGLFLVGLNKVFRKDLPTAGVSKNGIGVQLSVNPDFFNGLNEKHRIGLLKHELLHVSFGHLIMRDLYSNHKLFNIAADLEINQYIDSDKLPEGGLLLSSFPELNLPKKAGTKVYYNLLEEAKDDGTSPSLDGFMDEMNGESEYDHATWKEFDEMSEPDKKLVQKQVEHQLKASAEEIIKKSGNIPGECKELIDKLFHVEPAKFDWKQYLRRFAGNSNVVYTRKLRRKYNKRYAENPGLKIKFKNHILVGIDTSGSVNTDELKEFYNELHHMNKTGHQITIAQCDTKLNSVEKFNPKKDWEIKGRGGTSFQPVIDHYNELKGTYTALIYLTDGEAYAPENCPNNTLWVLSSISDMNDELPGKVIKLN